MEERWYLSPTEPGVCYALDPSRGVYGTDFGQFLCGCQECLEAQGLMKVWSEASGRYTVFPEGNQRHPVGYRDPRENGVRFPHGNVVFTEELERRLGRILQKFKDRTKI